MYTEPLSITIPDLKNKSAEREKKNVSTVWILKISYWHLEIFLLQMIK